jgi:hypothetical protein
MMEEGVTNDQSLEASGSELRSFAFNTHPQAYLNGGLMYVNLYDGLKILWTVRNDLINRESGRQIVKTLECAVKWTFTPQFEKFIHDNDIKFK